MIELYIGGKPCDIDQNMAILMQLQVEDTQNPTTQKNPYTQAITLAGTERNTAVFGNFERLDRKTQSGGVTGAYYDTTKRVPCVLLNNGELVIKGYCQLQSVSVSATGAVSYKVMLYSSLGDFLYRLSENDESGEKKTLADLRYYLTDDEGNELSDEQEFAFEMRNTVVAESFQRDNMQDGRTMLDYLAFIPTQQGKPSDIDTKKVLINTRGCDSIPAEKDGYGAYNGFILAECDNELDEAVSRDYRSYKQVPALRWRRLFETIIRKDNSGYDVHLSPSFFNENNPYWQRTFVTLPRFGKRDKAEDVNTVITTAGGGYIGRLDGSTALPSFDLQGEDDVKSISGGVDLSAYTLPTLKVTASITPTLTADTGARLQGIYEMWSDAGAYLGWNVSTNRSRYRSCIAIQMQAVADDGQVVGWSPVQVLGYNYTRIFMDGYIRRTTFDISKEWSKYDTSGTELKEADNAQFHYAKYDGTLGKWRMHSADNPNNDYTALPLTITNVQQTASRKYQLRVYMCWLTLKAFRGASGLMCQQVIDSQKRRATMNSRGVRCGFTFGHSDVEVSDVTEVRTNTKVTKQLLLGNTSTPADYLLSYCKLFGLRLFYDKDHDRIDILTREEFYNGETIDLTDRIDYSKEQIIVPSVTQSKWLRMKLQQADTKVAKLYKDRYSLEYGQQRINTGYSFNNDTKDLLDGGVFTQGITYNRRSDGYADYYTADHEGLPAWIMQSPKVTRYKEVDDTQEDTLPYTMISQKYTKQWHPSRMLGNDAGTLPLLCAMSDKGESTDIGSVLVFYNGRRGETFDSDAWGAVTDDVPEMHTLAGGACVLFAQCMVEGDNYSSMFSEGGTQICTPILWMPEYSSIYTQGGSVRAVLSIGAPRETFWGDTPALTSDTQHIYPSYWRAFMADRYDKDTKVVTLSVNIEGMRKGQQMLRQWYYFGGAIWVLNKVTVQYNGSDIVSCEFIKVENTESF